MQEPNIEKTAIFTSPKPYRDNKEKLTLSLTLKGQLPTNPSINVYYWTNDKYVRTGKTEVQDLRGEETEITFAKTPKVNFIFETHQNFKLVLCDGHRSKKEEIAQAEFKLSQVISQNTKGLDINFCEMESGASISDFCSVNVKYTRLGGGNRVEYKVDLKAFEVLDVDQYSKSDPFLVIKRPTDAYLTAKDKSEVPVDEWVEVVKTEYIQDNTNPNFKPFVIDGKDLCRGMENTILKVEIWDKSVDNDETIPVDSKISEAFFSVYSHLVPKKNIVTLDSEGKPAGTIVIERFERRDLFSMIQHIKYGLTLNLIASIDLTASNGNPKNKSSLHYIDPTGKKNQYQVALSKVFSVLEPYDTDKLIPVYGFGGMSPALGYNSTSHRFPLSGDEENPYAQGTQGVLDLYEEALPKLRLSGPTYFAPSIRQTIDQVREPFEKGEYSYTVLLLLTDGTICDIEETYKAIEEAAKLPISIIIIGVGDEDYAQMKILDGDHATRIQTINDIDNAEVEKGDADFNPVRDIVQFVPYRKYQNNPEGLAREVLVEIPKQISYFYWMITHRKNVFK